MLDIRNLLSSLQVRGSVYLLSQYDFQPEIRWVVSSSRCHKALSLCIEEVEMIERSVSMSILG